MKQRLFLWGRMQSPAGLRLAAAAVGSLLILVVPLATAAPIVQPAGPIELSSMEVRPTSAGTELRVEADGPLIWTQYRDEQGNLVVELPNTRVGANLGSLDLDSGLLERVEVVAEENGDRPLTRLLIRTRTPAEHSLFVDDRLLTLQFTGAQGATSLPAQPTVARTEEPVSSSAATPSDETDTATALAAVAESATGTPQAPMNAPPATGLPATRLLGVDTVQTDSGVALRILGDGEFNYSTFQLENPPRFVIDLDGVVNTSPRSSMALDASGVSQVRMAQFEPYPNPVTRVVLDLSGGSLPVIGRGPDGLVLNFGGAASGTEALIAELEPDSEPDVIDVADPEVTDLAETSEEMAMDEVAETEPQDVMVAEEEDAALVQSTVADAGLTAEPEPVAEMAADDLTEEEPLQELIPEGTTLETTDSTESMDSTVQETATLAQAQTPPAATPIEIVLSPEDAQEPEIETFDVAAETEQTPEALQEPLFIDDTTRRERPTLRPGDEDVTLYEAQEVSPLSQSEERSGSEVPSFGVQTVDNTRRWVGEPVTMSLKDASITEVLRTIARVSNLNLVIQPGVEGTVTVELVAVPWDQALDQILKVNGLGMQLDGNILRVAETRTLQEEAVAEQTLKQARALSVPLTTVLKRLSYARANDVARILTQAQRSGGRGGSLGRIGLITPAGILSQRGTVAVDNRTNTLIIQELPDYLDTVIQVIENLDTPERQVMIEARVVEATRNFSRSLGVQWGLQGEASPRLGNTTGLQFPNNIQGDGGVQLLTGGNNGSLNLSLGNILNSFQLDVALQAAENEGLINIISAPKVATLNNERASVQSGLQIPIQTVANNTVSVQFINATLRLSVQPQVTAEGTIIMDIDIQKREPLLAFAVVGATNAPISTRDAQTRVIVRDGGTAVIGGIYSISSNEGTDRVPGLANIPVLGHLFKNRSKDTSNEELLIFITPRVIQL